MADNYPMDLAHMRRALRKGDKGEVRGNILPLKRSGDGELSPAWPEILREAGVGVLDLLAGTRTGQVTPEALGAVLEMAGGGVATAPMRGAGLGVLGGHLAKTSRELPTDLVAVLDRYARGDATSAQVRNLAKRHDFKVDLRGKSPEIDVWDMKTGKNVGYHF